MADRRHSKEEFKDRLYRRRYLIPNAVTLGNMFCGFLTIVYASSARYEKAAIAIFIAIVLDGLDGRVARRLNATSKFGLEFDSFSDLISFGVAPAILMYHWCFLPQADEFGVTISFVYILCAMSRLARFNISHQNLDKFEGLPTPGAAALVAALVFASPVFPTNTLTIAAGAVLMIVMGLLMVSSLEFFSVKNLRISSVHVVARIALGALIGLLWYSPKIGLLTLASAYVFSGPVQHIFKKEAPEQKAREETRLAG